MWETSPIISSPLVGEGRVRWERYRMKKRGVTLLEMIIVMSIIVIITAASVPSFMKFASTARLRAAARDITTALRSARRYAITKRTNYMVAVYTNANDSIKNAVSFYETADSVKLQWAAANIYFTARDDASDDYLPFNFSSRGTTGGDTISVVDPENRYIDITVETATGRVKIGDIQQ